MSLLRQRVAGAQAANAFEVDTNGNTAASIAMTASRFSSNLCQRWPQSDAGSGGSVAIGTMQMTIGFAQEWLPWHDRQKAASAMDS
jgi:hypothetical protein